MIITEHNERELFPNLILEVYDTKNDIILKKVKSFDSETNELICYYFKQGSNRVELAEGSIFKGGRKVLLTLDTNHYIEIRNKETKEIVASSSKKVRDRYEKIINDISKT